MRTCRLKSTKQVVYVIDSGERYAECLVPYGRETKKGYRAEYCIINKDKLMEEKVYGYG